MIAVAGMVQRIQTCYTAETELVRTIVNAASVVEVNLALDILRETVPQRTLVAALAVREMLGAIPSFPCTMGIDDETLARVAGLQKDRLAWKKDLADGCGISVTMAGNFCFDIIVQADGASLFLTPTSPGVDLISPGAADAFIAHPAVLAEVVTLLGDMGLTFSPKPYLSLEDWALDHAQETIHDIQSLF